MQGNECVGVVYGNSNKNRTLPLCRDGNLDAAPHWLPITTRPSSQALELRWANHSGATVLFVVNASLHDCSSLDWIDMRIANDPDGTSVNFDLEVLDQSGRNSSLASNLTIVSDWPGLADWGLARVHARTLRYSLASVRSQVDVTNIVAIFLVARSNSGRVWVLDVAGTQDKVAIPTGLNLPALSLESLSVKATYGFGVYTMDIITDQPLRAPASIWVQPVGYFIGFVDGYQLDLIPSSSTIVAQISVNVTYNDLYPGYTEYFLIEAVEGVVTDNYILFGLC
jgi:hypothetical protein